MKRLSGWNRLWIVCAILMWGYGSVWFFRTVPYIGGPPDRDEMVCYGERPLTDDEIFAGTESPASAAELLRQLDQGEATKQRESAEPRSALSERLASMRDCSREEEEQQLANYYGSVAGAVLAALFVLLLPFSLAGAFFVARWIWRGFQVGSAP